MSKKNDTIYPLGILDAVHGMFKRVLNSEKGEVDVTNPNVTDPNPPPANDEDWRSSLPDNIKAHPVFQKYNSPNEALSAFVDVQKLIGPEKIIMPSKEADDNEWNERVFDRLGRPKKPEEYGLPTDLQIPKELPVSEKLTQSFREQAHKLGILPKQFQGLYKWFMNEQIATYNDHVTANKTNADKSRSELRTEWGAAYDQNLSMAEKVLNAYGDDNTVNFIKQKGLHTDANFVKFLHNIGKVLSEDQLGGKPQSLTMSPDEAKAELSKMENDMKHPLFNAQHPEHQESMKKREMLYRMAYPNG